MALGMHKAGFEHEQLVENNPKACEILRVNADRNPQFWKSENVREMDIQDWLCGVTEMALEDIDLVAGGPPCQPFSIGNRNAGKNDERNMFPAAIETVRLLRPKLFVFENVPGLLRENFLAYYEYIEHWLAKPEVIPRSDGEAWEEHHQRINNAREHGLVYTVHRLKIDAADWGVPQVRKRIFLIGIRQDIPQPQPWKTPPLSHCQDALLHAQWITGEYWEEMKVKAPPMPDRLAPRVHRLKASEETPKLNRWQTTRDAIKNLPQPMDYAETLGVLNHWGIPGARVYKGHTGGPIDWPAKTLKAGVHGVCGGEAMIRFNDGCVRYLTIREAARVQSFPDEYEIPGTRGAAMRALGNAVAVDVAAAIGQHLRSMTGI
jgi:DNA (cytosine-5)-methyltransferase 1